MRSLRTAAEGVRLPLAIAVSMFLALPVPEAIPQTAPNLWSIQLDGGMLQLNEARGPSPRVGMRYSKHYTPHIQGGLLTGYTYKGTSIEAPAAGAAGSESHVELARTEARLLSVMGFMQVDLTDKFFLVPFVGIGAGYEWLNLHASDRRTGEDSTMTFRNIAWEGYGGMGVRVTRKVRVNGELFYNGGSLERHAANPGGTAGREAVHVNGVGARLGVDMVFE